MTRPYARTTHDGKVVDQITHHALMAAERILGYPLTVLQGSYNPGGVASSGGTHDGGGAVDLAAWDWQRKVRVLRRVGFAAWYRPELWKDGKRVWGAHVHAVLIGNKRLSPAAQKQVTAYYAHRDGLSSNLPDPTRHPDPQRVFHMPVPLGVDLLAALVALRSARAFWRLRRPGRAKAIQGIIDQVNALRYR